jgi:hypothetical protein
VSEVAEIEVYNLDLDEELLSHLAIPDSVREIRADGIGPELIEDEFVRKVWDWQMAHLRKHGVPATPSVLADEFDIDFSSPLTVPEVLMDKMRERFTRNGSRMYMERVAKGYKEDPSKVADLLLSTGRELHALMGKKGESFGTGDYQRAIDAYDEAVLKGPGPSFGFKELDEHFHGMMGLTVGLAPPKTYKSWIYGANTIVENVKNGVFGHLYSLELPAKDTDWRIRCLAAGIPYWKYLRGRLSQHDRNHLREVSETLDELGMYRVTKPPPGRRTIEEMVETAADAGAAYVIIDQLQYVETQNGKQLGAGDHKDYWQPLNAARDLSDAIPIVIVHQFNRTVMGADKMPEMSQAKAAAAIEEVATLGLGLWANKDMRRSNIVELGTLISRHYEYVNWELGVELSQGCDFKMYGVVDHSDDED